MKIEFYCPECTAVIESESLLPGTGMICPGCQENIVAPEFPIGPGTSISGYRIIGKIGVGGMGGVYLAEQTSMSRHVALKVLPPSVHEDPSFLERFLGEVRMLGALRHPNIATAYDAGSENDVHYLAMEYIDGYDLHTLIQREGAMEEGEALRIAVRIADGLEYAWTRDHLVHRDIKPGNIMIDQHGEVKILDLGVSISRTEGVSATEEEQAVLGTPQYMSPEQVGESGSVDVRADIYSLGATLYHMLTGQPPFTGSSLDAIIEGRSDVRAPSVRDFNPRVSRACAALIEIMMARDPGHRPGDWKACRRDLERVMARKQPAFPRPAPDESMVARPRAETTVAMPRGVPSPRSRPPVLRHVFVALVIAVLLVALFLWSRGMRTPLPENDNAASAPRGTGNVDPAANLEREKEVLTLRREWDSVATALQAGVQPSDEMLLAIENIRDSAARLGSREIQSEIDQAKTKLREKGIEDRKRVMAKLEKEAAFLIEVGEIGEAVKIFTDYDGSMKVITATARSKRADEIGAFALSVSEQRLAGILHDIASLIVSNESQQRVLASLTEARKAAASDAESEKLAAAEEELRAALTSQARIIPTYLDDVGREIQVRLRRGTRVLRIENVSSTRVQATERIHGGSRDREFQLSDLSVEERTARLEKIGDPATIMMRGLLFLQRDKYEAGRLLDESGGELAGAIADLLRNGPEDTRAVSRPQ